MTKLHPPKTGLETRFENEMASTPGWHPWTEGRETSRPRKQPLRKESRKDRIVEETMILGR